MASKKDSRLNGINPLAYMGVNAYSPSNTVEYNRPPTSADRKNFDIGAIWIDISPVAPLKPDVWMLVRFIGNESTWIKIAEGESSGEQFVTDSGTAIPALGILNVLGGNSIDTSGAGSTVTVSLADDVLINNDLTFTLFGAGVLQTNVAGVTSTSKGTDGQVLISDSAGAPAWANITGISGLVTVADGANTIDLDLSGTIADIFQTDTLFAQPVGGVLEIAGGTSITTTGSGNVVTIDVGDDVCNLFGADVGFAVPVSNTIVLSGGANVTTNAAGSTVTFTATGGGGGGSANASFLAHQVANGGDPYLAGGGVSLGAAVVMTEVYDIGNNFTVGDGAGTPARFTAPQDGKYLFTCQISIKDLAGLPNVVSEYFEIQTSNRKYRCRRSANTATNNIVEFGGSLPFSVIADMDAADTAEFFVINNQNIGITTIEGDVAGTGEYQTFVSGSLEESDVFGFTEHAVLVGDATSGIGELALATNGQVLIGATGAASAWANITAGANITINEGANTLEIVSTGGGLGSSVSSFLAYQATDESTGLPLDGQLGEDVVLTEVYDTGTDFYPGDGAGTAANFTAPQTGKYQLNFAVTIGDWEAAIITSNGTYYSLAQRPGTGTTASTLKVIVVADMDIGDTAAFAFKRGFNGAQGNITSGIYTGAYQTYVSGTLV